MVDLEHAVECLDVDADDAGAAAIDPRLDPADHAGAAAERNHRGPGIQGPFEHGLDLGLVARARDYVGWVLELPAEPPDDIAVGASERVQRTLVVIGEADALQ